MALQSFLQIENLTKSYGDRLLFGDVTFGLFEGDKVGIIARNGTGKSTLLRIIAGDEDADSGDVIFRGGLRVGWLPQEPDFDLAKTALQQLTELPHSAEDWDFSDRCARMLGQVGIKDVQKPIGEMSGGQAKRVALARVLMREPELLLLDEPTNHLDIDVIEWLEKYLQRQRITLLMVTHDRWFLDNVCNRIIEIEDAGIYTYRGNYDYYLQKRQERLEARGAELAKVKNILRTEQEWMRRQPQARGGKARYRIENFAQLQKQRAGLQKVENNLALENKKIYIGSKIFEAHNVCKSFGEKKILDNWSYTFARHDKVGIVGDNGTGKTTFLRMLLGELQPDSGYFDVGETVRWGYYSQQGITFAEDKRVIDAVTDVAEHIVLSEKQTLSASQFLTRFLFTPTQQQTPIRKLSGGEKRRLYLAMVLMANPNFLILDEPTNDLDIITLSVLEDYLAGFKGCVIVVSHDRFFLNRIAEHLFVFRGDGRILDFPGDYATYRHCLEQERAEVRKSVPASAKKSKPRSESSRSVRLTFKEKQLKEKLEKELPEMESRRDELQARMSSGSMNSSELMQAGADIQTLIAAIDEAEMQLLELMEKED